MKKTIFALALLGFGLQSNVMADWLNEPVVIPAINPSEASIPKKIIIEQNEVILNPALENKKFNNAGNNSLKETKNINSAKVEGNIYHPMIDMLGKYKNEIKVIYTDIDGILVNENEKTIVLKDSIYKSFKNLKEKNIPVIFTTGRTYREAKRIAEALDITPDYYVTQNGAEIVNSNDEIIYEKPIDWTNVFKVSEEVKWFNYHYRQNLRIAYYERGKVYVRRNAEIPNLVDVPVVIDKFLDLPRDAQISKIRIYAKDDNSLDIFRRYLAKFYKKTLVVDNVAKNYIDVNINTATKANAVNDLSKLTGISLANSAGFGYSQTDVGLMNLLRDNGGLAISTEKSAQEVKDASSYITKDIDNDGFNFAINTILGNNLILKSE